MGFWKDLYSRPVDGMTVPYTLGAWASLLPASTIFPPFGTLYLNFAFDNRLTGGPVSGKRRCR